MSRWSAGKSPITDLDRDVGDRVLVRLHRSASGYVFTRRFNGREHRGAQALLEGGYATHEPRGSDRAYVITEAGRERAREWLTAHPNYRPRRN